ncbi:Tetratricopeptide repeat-containing protein [Pustulibacterium marinum]|uniref:histidine kinase n=2 Tax=Pustulibacterium marinum TaxID=1224947 RepID=A0A1I7GYM8_9FLAO|nr:Tetratricopeptide repeat-containing protein [Pustulibacterium marinum]
MQAQEGISTPAVFDQSWRKAHTAEEIQQALQTVVAEAKEQHDSLTLQRAYRYQFHYATKQSFPDVLEASFSQYYQLSESLQDTSALQYALRRKARFYYDQNNYFEALKAFEQELVFANARQELKDQVYLYRYIASLQSKLGLYFESEATVLQALRMLPENEATYESLTGLYNQLGIIYKERDQFEEARSYYEKSRSFSTKPDHLQTIQNNVANVYVEAGNYPKAISLFEDLLSRIDSIADTKDYARALDNLGKTLTLQHDAHALSYLQRGLDLRTQLNYATGIYSSYYHLAIYYQTFGQHSKALYYASQALAIAETHAFQEELLEIYQLLISLGATEYATDYLRMKDSIDHAIQLQAEKYVAYKYNYRKEHQLAEANHLKYQQSELERQVATQHTIIWQLVAGITLLLFAGGLWLYRNYRKRKAQQAIYATETRIGKQIHDEIANDIYQTMQKVTYSVVDQDQLLTQLDGIYQRSRNISKAHSSIVTDGHFQEALQDLLHSYQAPELILVSTGMTTIAWEELSEARKICLYRVLQEFMTNMRKHSKATLVKLSFTMKGKKLYVTYTDNGVGTDTLSKSGLQHAENRIRALNGSLTFTTAKDKGFQATMIL